MKTFREQYQQLAQSGALSNPEIKTLTENLALGIGNISESLENSVANLSKGDTASQQTVAEMMASQLSHTKSTLICNTGGGTDPLHNCR